MEDKDQNALRIIGRSLLAFFEFNHGTKRQCFQEKLSASLKEISFEVESSSFGRGPNMVGIWTVSVVTPRGPKRERIQISSIMEPYSEDAFQAILGHFQDLSKGAPR
jgi:hypothetical protein